MLLQGNIPFFVIIAVWDAISERIGWSSGSVLNGLKRISWYMDYGVLLTVRCSDMYDKSHHIGCREETLGDLPPFSSFDLSVRISTFHPGLKSFIHLTWATYRPASGAGHGIQTDQYWICFTICIDTSWNHIIATLDAHSRFEYRSMHLVYLSW